MPARRRTVRRRPRSRLTAEDFADYLDPGGLIPHDLARFEALCAALIEANGGSTIGPVCPDVVALLTSSPGDRLADYLTAPEGDPEA